MAEEMNHWWMIICGVMLIIGGFTLTDFRRSLHGSTPTGPIPLRIRVLLVAFGVFMCILGAIRLMSN